MCVITFDVFHTFGDAKSQEAVNKKRQITAVSWVSEMD